VDVHSFAGQLSQGGIFQFASLSSPSGEEGKGAVDYSVLIDDKVCQSLFPFLFSFRECKKVDNEPTAEVEFKTACPVLTTYGFPLLTRFGPN
jgi:hypothetical protein